MPTDATIYSAAPQGNTATGSSAAVDETAAVAAVRASLMPATYSPTGHIARTLMIAAIIAAGAAWFARGASPWDFALIPVFFMVGNAVEWLIHRNPMHRPLRPRILYTNHALVHHRAFHFDTMEIQSGQDLGLIMMPWYTMLLIFASVSPIAIAVGLWRGPGAAGLFYLASLAYFLAYETTHLLYHLPAKTLARAGLSGRVFRWLQAHHTHHHRLERMAHVNFNVTFPLMDTLMRTREKALVDTREHRS